MERLKINQKGPGFCNFPSDRDLDFYEMLCAERPIRKIVHGEIKRLWVKVSSHAHNEALDTAIYCLCGLHAAKSYGYDRIDTPEKSRPCILLTRTSCAAPQEYGGLWGIMTRNMLK